MMYTLYTHAHTHTNAYNMHTYVHTTHTHQCSHTHNTQISPNHQNVYRVLHCQEGELTQMLSTLGDGWKMTQVTYTQHMFLLPCDFIWRQFLTHVSCPISVPPPHAPPLPSPSPSPAIPSQLVNIGSQYSYSSQDQSEFLVVVSKEFNNPLPGSDTKPTDKEKVSVLTMCSHLLLSPPVPKGFKTAWLQDVNLTTETVFVCCFITSFIVHKDDHACMHVHMCSAHQAFHGTV